MAHITINFQYMSGRYYMRKDMDKVLVTTPRVGSRMKNGEIKKSRRQMRENRYDELPRYSSMKPKSRNWDDR